MTTKNTGWRHISGSLAWAIILEYIKGVRILPSFPELTQQGDIRFEDRLAR